MIKYPNKKKPVKKTINSVNRGMILEVDLNLTNQYYLENNIAIIHKKPTPVQVVKVSYPARNLARITEAYYKTPSTTDYNGIFEGQYIDFDAKETSNKTSFPLKNIHSHQITHLKSITKHGGIAFLIVHFKYHNKYFLLPSKVLFLFWDNQTKKEGRKSIPYEIFLTKAFEIPFTYYPRLDYLKIIKTCLQ